jgi:FHA domain
VSDMQALLEQHDRARRLLLEGESTPEVERHAATCLVCGPLAARLAEVERSVREIPEPPPELLGKILRRTSRPRLSPEMQPRPSGAAAAPAPARPQLARIEMLFPAESNGDAIASSPGVVPLVLAVEADRHPSDGSSARPMERVIIVCRYPILVGRGPDMDIPIWDRSVSRRHAEIDWRDDVWSIRDLESTNGSRVDGSPLGPSEVRPLNPGDRIDLGFYARLTVRSLLPVLHPNGVGGDIQRLLGWAGR